MDIVVHDPTVQNGIREYTVTAGTYRLLSATSPTSRGA
jgi:hypothetical protein